MYAISVNNDRARPFARRPEYLSKRDGIVKLLEGGQDDMAKEKMRELVFMLLFERVGSGRPIQGQWPGDVRGYTKVYRVPATKEHNKIDGLNIQKMQLLDSGTGSAVSANTLNTFMPMLVIQQVLTEDSLGFVQYKFVVRSSYVGELSTEDALYTLAVYCGQDTRGSLDIDSDKADEFLSLFRDVFLSVEAWANESTVWIQRYRRANPHIIFPCTLAEYGIGENKTHAHYYMTDVERDKLTGVCLVYCGDPSTVRDVLSDMAKSQQGVELAKPRLVAALCSSTVNLPHSGVVISDSCLNYYYDGSAASECKVRTDYMSFCVDGLPFVDIANNTHVMYRHAKPDTNLKRVSTGRVVGWASQIPEFVAGMCTAAITVFTRKELSHD